MILIVNDTNFVYSGFRIQLHYFFPSVFGILLE